MRIALSLESETSTRVTEPKAPRIRAIRTEILSEQCLNNWNWIVIKIRSHNMKLSFVLHLLLSHFIISVSSQDDDDEDGAALMESK